MNVIRTIPKCATLQWVDLLFDPESSPAPEDFRPLDYPFPVTFRRNLAGGFLYVRYRGEIIGYGKIAEVRPHFGDTVGAENTVVEAGDNIVLEAPILRMPFVLSYPAPFRWKYIETNLHQMPKGTE